ncbi:MAG TPA: RluA family pseudouridine synthase [Bryobacteraceae bacterium]|nr:RluA family pseudouridine synthase [Bryobacteraceae bacterium]
MLTTLTVSVSDAGKRLDHYLHEQIPSHSRARLQGWVKSGLVTVNGRPEKASFLLRGGEALVITPDEPPPLKAAPEDLPLDILYEDDGVVAINKRAGMVVHAGAGNYAGTLVNALLHRYRSLSGVGGSLRPGIVHRLDRYTSGVILVAKTDPAHRALAAQFSGRTVEKIYTALVHGEFPERSGEIRAPIARDPVHRTRMTARLASGREALTRWEVIRRFDRYALLDVRIGTGRTHQIRVHLKSIGHAVAGDKLYGAPPHHSGRFFLHARQIRFLSPISGQPVTVSAPLPDELEEWLKEL